ncbi:hypothetical protein PtB15_18B37 [Puccinia triticina]|nr:hypothetical protein PtB15_18B37 [Puccinia triticina]
MAPGPGLNYYELTSRASFWVLIWLTCLLLDQNVQCAFYLDPDATWLLRAPITMQESDRLNDILHFAHSPLPESHPTGGINTLPPSESDHLNDFLHLINSPWPQSHLNSHGSLDNTELGYLHNNNIHNSANSPRPESHPTLSTTNTHSTTVQKKRKKYDIKKIKTSVRKKVKDSSDGTSPAFEIINSERPVKIEKKVIFEAIRSLKKFNGERFVGNEGEDEYKMLKIEEVQIRNFLSQVVRARNIYLPQQNGRARLVETIKGDFAPGYQKRRHDAVARFKTEANNEELKLKSLYTDRVIPQFADSMEQLKVRIGDKYSQSEGQAKELLKDFKRIRKILPIYLFYLDLINTVIPDQGVATEGVTTLELQRKAAGQQFLQYVGELIENPHLEEHSTGEKSRLASQDLRKTTTIPKFYWNILAKWIYVSRTSLAFWVQTDEKTLGIQPSFKHFFNEIFTCYIEKFTNKPMITLD